MTYLNGADEHSPDNPQPIPFCTRYAALNGPLTPKLLAVRQAEAQRCSRPLLAILPLIEAEHLRRVFLTLPPPATWEEAARAIHSTAAAT